MDSVERKKPNLSPIGELLTNSWKSLKENLASLIIWTLIVMGLYILVFIIGIIFALPLGGLTLFQIIGGKADPAVLLPSIVGLVILGIIFIIVLIFLGSALQIGSILIVGKGERNYGNVIKRSLALVFPFIITSIIASFIVFGALFVFIIAGIILQLAFSFIAFEVILNGQSYTSALKRSMKIFFSNPGPILLRFLLIFVIYLSISFAPSYTIGLVNENAGSLYNFFGFFINLLLGWYMLCYQITLYKEASKGYENDKGTSLVWPTIIALIGWIIAFFVIVFLISFASTIFKANKDKLIPPPVKEQQQQQKPSTSAAIKTSNELFSKIRTSNDLNSKKNLADQNINVLKDAIALDPDSAELWNMLSDAYSWPNSIGNANDILDASKKAVELEPNNPRYLTTLGSSYLGVGKYNEAVLELEKAVRLDSTQAITYYNLGIAYADLGIKDQAIINLQKAIDIYTGENKNGIFDQRILNARKELAKIKGN